MLHNILIALHAACALAAFVLGVAAVWQPSNQMTSLFRTYLATLWLMVLFLIAVVLLDWSTIDITTRIIFSALLALAVYTGWRGWQAAQDLTHQHATWRNSFVENVGFTLIALFAGFVIVSSIDLGAPIWLVIAIGVAGVLLGRYGVQRLKQRSPTHTEVRSGAT